MKKELTKKEVKKITLPEVMKKYGATFSIETKEGFAHLDFSEKGMTVIFLDEEGYERASDESVKVPFDDVKLVADFMQEMKDMRLEDYSRIEK